MKEIEVPPVRFWLVVKVAPIGMTVSVLLGGTLTVRRAVDAVPRRRIAPRKGPIHSTRIFCGSWFAQNRNSPCENAIPSKRAARGFPEEKSFSV